MRKIKVRNLVVVLRESEYRSLRCEIPQDNVTVITLLSRCNDMSLICDSEASDLIVMSS